MGNVVAVTVVGVVVAVTAVRVVLAVTVSVIVEFSCCCMVAVGGWQLFLCCVL